jgi:hypothetical protein
MGVAWAWGLDRIALALALAPLLDVVASPNRLPFLARADKKN